MSDASGLPANVEATAGRLGPDHVSWLLVSAYAYLQQDMPERAATLLNFLRVFDPGNRDCLKMLAYVCLQMGRAGQCLDLIEEALRLPMTDAERATMQLLRIRAAGGADRSARRLKGNGAQRLAAPRGGEDDER